MSARPSDDLFTWATAPTADMTEPPSQRKSNGWVAGLQPPAGYWNWLLKNIAQWLAYKLTSPSVYPTLQAAYAEVDPGDIVIIDEADSAIGSSPGDEKSSGLTATATIGSLVTTGKSVIYSTGSTVKELERDDFTTVIRTFTLSISGSPIRMVTDGKYLVACTGRYAECLLISDGSSVWTHDFGASLVIADVALSRSRVVFGGTHGAGGANVYCLKLQDGTTYWSFNHGAAVKAVAATGLRAFIAGAASGYASGATLRAVTLDSGAAKTNEGGAAVDSTGSAWNVVQADAQVHRATLATDGRSLWCGLPSTAAVQLEQRGCGDGASIATKTIAGYSVQGLAADQGFLFCVAVDGSSHGATLALSRHNLAMAWGWKDASYDHTTVATDGAALFVGRGGVVSPAPALYRRIRGNTPTKFRATDYTYDANFAGVSGVLTPSVE